MRHLLPRSWSPATGDVRVGGASLSSLAGRFGTPLLVTDEAHLLARLDAFREAFGPATTLVYAGKAFLCGALLEHLDRAGWWVDVVSAGEMEIVSRAGLDAGRILMHGNAKPRGELADALACGVGRIVVDHPGEVDVLAGLAATVGREAPVLIRLNADVAAVTHEKVKTTGARAQFGMDLATAARVVADAATRAGISLRGVHIHVGSQIRDLSTFRRAAAAVVSFLEPVRSAFPERVDVDLGGGLPVPYLRDDATTDVDAYAAAILGGLDEARAADRLGDHRLFIEPGRSVVATSTVTLYRVEARKTLPDGTELIAVDGGLSDNPRPSLYGQRYEVLAVSRAGEGPERRFHVVGRHCETGDIVNEAALLPDSTVPGDLVAVPVTGAYAHAMSSRYNGLRRPAVVYSADGEAREVVRRETLDDLVACDPILSARPPGSPRHP
ncbi:MAG: diaminopimelate decarboxylase [Gemmatimonadota bacterium]|nr:diaminopimelate decarboxylase [Gemmatimonadota bacterium]